MLFTDLRFSPFVLFLLSSLPFLPLPPPVPPEVSLTRSAATWQGWKTTAARFIFDFPSSAAISHVNWQFFEHARCFLYRRAKIRKHRYGDQTKICLWSSALLPGATSPRFFRWIISRIEKCFDGRQREEKRRKGRRWFPKLSDIPRIKSELIISEKPAIESMFQSLRNNSGFVLLR